MVCAVADGLVQRPVVQPDGGSYLRRRGGSEVDGLADGAGVGIVSVGLFSALELRPEAEGAEVTGVRIGALRVF